MEEPSEQQKGETPLTIVLVESELELIPEKVQGFPFIRKQAQDRGKAPASLLLDSSLHHGAMRKLEDFQRRGRPDIVHRWLLFAQDSPLNRRGLLTTYIHTWDDRTILVNPELRPPKSYNRFVGLMEELFEKGVIMTKEGATLLKMENKPLRRLLKKLGTRNVLLWENGRDVDAVDYFRENQGKKICLLVGGFPHGDFRKAAGLSDENVRLGSEQLSATTISAQLLFSYGEAHKQS